MKNIHRSIVSAVVVAVVFVFTPSFISLALAQVGRVSDSAIMVRFESADWQCEPEGVLAEYVSDGCLEPISRLLPKWAVLRVAPGSADLAEARVREIPGIEYAYCARLGSFATTPNDPSFSSQWGLQEDAIDAVNAWDTRTTSGVIVAVLDSGINYNHSDISPNMWQNSEEIDNDIDDDNNDIIDDIYGAGFDTPNVFCPHNYNNGDPMDVNFHGTACAAIIGARGNNSIGTAGVCWTVKLMAVRIAKNCEVSEDAFAKGMAYAVEQGANIVNLSVLWSEDTPGLFDAMLLAQQNGLIVVCAAGNQGRDIDDPPANTLMFPGAYSTELDNVLTVANVEEGDELAASSNFGERSVPLGAPGDGTPLPSGIVTGDLFAGTSAAAPHVAGVAALVWAEYPTSTAQEVVARIKCTIRPVSALSGKTVTGGMVNAYSAITLDCTE